MSNLDPMHATILLQNVDFLFGLDMLKRHQVRLRNQQSTLVRHIYPSLLQCCIDLRKNVLRLADGDDSHEVAFLPEHVSA